MRPSGFKAPKSPYYIVSEEMACWMLDEPFIFFVLLFK
jgi:hypothetical protein